MHAPEEWKIVDRNPNYEVSNFGRVRRCAPGRGTRVGKVLKFRPCRGYMRVGLGCKDESVVHRLVAQAFLPKPKGTAPGSHGWVVNHKDGDRANNRVENLEWTTQKKNLAHCPDCYQRQTGAQWTSEPLWC